MNPFWVVQRYTPRAQVLALLCARQLERRGYLVRIAEETEGSWEVLRAFVVLAVRPRWLWLFKLVRGGSFRFSPERGARALQVRSSARGHGGPGLYEEGKRMRILANYGCKANGDSYSVTFETMGDVPSEKAPATVDELFRLAREAVQRQVSPPAGEPWEPEPVTVPRPVQGRVAAPAAPGNGGGNGRRPSPKDPTLPATDKQLRLIRQLARQAGAPLEGLEDLTMGEASSKIDELLAGRG